MREVIKHGLYCKPCYIITCHRCECTFVYNGFDRHGYDQLHKDEYVTCPECNKWNLHKYSKPYNEIKN